jgi:hypothetical protein
VGWGAHWCSTLKRPRRGHLLLRRVSSRAAGRRRSQCAEFLRRRLPRFSTGPTLSGFRIEVLFVLERD